MIPITPNWHVTVREDPSGVNFRPWRGTAIAMSDITVWVVQDATRQLVMVRPHHVQWDAAEFLPVDSGAL